MEEFIMRLGVLTFVLYPVLAIVFLFMVSTISKNIAGIKEVLEQILGRLLEEKKQSKEAND